MQNKWIITVLFISFMSFQVSPLHSQAGTRVMTLSLEDVITIAQEQSPQAILAQHRFRASYWQFRTFRAEFLPSLNLSATLPDFNRTIANYTLPDGTDTFIERNTINTVGSLSLNQNIPFTGGRLFMSSELQRVDNLDQDTASYRTTPVNIGYRQSLTGYNQFRWQREIEPLRYEEAQRNYISSMENVAVQALGLFFDLALAQVNMDIAELNYENTDSLYKIAEGRYNIGTIPENQLLQMELSSLNAGTSLNSAILDLELRKNRLRSFLGYNETVDLELIIDTEVPKVNIELDRAIEFALQYNPEVIQMQRQLLEAEQSVAQAKANRGFNADLFAVYGLTQSAGDIPGAYRDPQVSQRVQIGLEIPLIDWGLGRGRYRMAQSSQEVTRTQVEQSRIDFEQNVYLEVMQFNMQYDQLEIAAKADTIAKKRFDVTYERFMIGRIDVRDLNDAIAEQDVAKRSYITQLRNFWRYYYNLRVLTHYDFERNRPIIRDFDNLIL